MLIFPRKYQHSGQLFRPETVFRSFSQNSPQNGKMQIFAEKCDFFKKINFLVSGISFPAPSLKSLRNQCLFRCFGLHFLPFCIFHSKMFFRAKTVFGAEMHIFAKKCVIFDFSLQNAKNAQGIYIPINTVSFIGILSSFSRKGGNVRNFAFLRGISGFHAPFRFFRSKWKNAKMRF